LPGEHSRRTGPATIRSALYHRTRDSIEAHLTIVLAALAVSRWIEDVRDKEGRDDHVKRALAHHLIGDRDVPAARIAGLRQAHAPSLDP
jgi:hypothetical protein